MFTITEEMFEQLKQQYHNVKSDFLKEPREFKENVLNDSVSKFDEILSSLKRDSSDYIKLLSMKASIFYEMAKILLGNDSLNDSERLLKNGLETIMEDLDEPQITFLYLRIVNYLSYVLSRLGKLEEAKKLLETLINKNIKCVPKVYSTEDLFANFEVDEKLAKSKMDKLIINNLQMLSWIYGKLGLTDSYLNIQHKCLQKELDINDGDPIQWAIRCYRLASLYLTKCDWKNSRYYLTAAQVVLDPLEIGMSPNPMLHRAQADLARVWVNYGLHMFSVSRKNILINKVNGVNKDFKFETSANFTECRKFTDLEVKEPNIPIVEIIDSETAKALFVFIHKWLKRARLYYTLRDYPIQYVNIILELSELYRCLAFYESDIDSQYNLQKKRYETLENLNGILKDMRPYCYNVVSIELLKDLISVQIELINLNLKKIYNPNDETNINQDDLKNRMNAMIVINSKLENIGNAEDQFPSTDTFLDIVPEEVQESIDVKINESINENKGEGEGQLDDVCPSS